MLFIIFDKLLSNRRRNSIFEESRRKIQKAKLVNILDFSIPPSSRPITFHPRLEGYPADPPPLTAFIPSKDGAVKHAVGEEDVHRDKRDP